MNKIADARSDDVGPLSNLRSPYFSPEHEMLRAQVRRFVETEIKPKALAWEDAAGKVWLAANDPRWIARRHGLGAAAAPTADAMAAGLEGLVKSALGSR